MHVPMVSLVVTLQVRDVPDDVSRVLKDRAAASGQSLSEYVLAELKRIAARPTIDELTARVKARGGVEPGIPAAEIIRADRDDETP